MPVAAGTRFGPYTVLSPLGAGGMGEVYLARDERLGRDVALKVLPEHLAATPEVRARFEREARAVSSLNHPHICTLYDVGHQDGVDYLVLERLEGETLAARIERGALPAEEVLRFGMQIADALDRAHRSGIIHRDLKPGNIMLTRSGAKLLDFGLARPVLPAGDASSLSVSPTMSRPLTTAGTLIGTFQYMSPEQLEGKEADTRSDIWALGLILYEMATGKRAFEGRSQAGLIAAVLERDPPSMSSIAPLTPPGLERLVKAAIAKNPEDRIQTAHDVKLQLQWIAEGGSAAGIPAPVVARRRSRERLLMLVAGAASAAAVVLAAAVLLRPETQDASLRFTVQAPPKHTDMNWPRVSPDGKLLAFLAQDSAGVSRIWVRGFHALEAQPLAGTEGAGRPFWSPDSRYLAFVSDGKLRKIPVGGGPPSLISEVPGRWDGSWGSQDVILLDGGQSDSLVSVPAGGGSARPGSFKDRSLAENGHSWPFFLPDGRHFLFIASRIGAEQDNHIKLGRLGSTTSWELSTCDSRVEFSPPRHVVFIREGILVAQVLDLGKKKLVGEAVPVTDRLATTRNSGDFSCSAAGVLAWSSNTSGGTSELVWVDRSGRRLGVAAPPAGYREISISPDGTKVAAAVADPRSGRQDIWVRDLERGVASRLTFDEGEEAWPVWSPDGRKVLYASTRRGEFKLYARLASGVGAEDSLAVHVKGIEGPTDWSRDGRWIISTILGERTDWDIYHRRAEPGAREEPFLNTAHVERNAVLSPDGRWLAYRSNETGRPEIYVRSFPGGEGKWQVSSRGGINSRWRADGREMFFLSPEYAVMAVPVEPGDEFRSGIPVELFRFVPEVSGYIERRWDVTGDGQRFLINTPAGSGSRPEIAVAMNWLLDVAGR